MPDNDPVTLWLEELRDSEDDAARKLWNHFVVELCSQARKKLSPATRRVYDEEDAVQSAFRSVCVGISSGRFPDLKDRNGLMALLLVITTRKVVRRHEHDGRQRRDVSRNISDMIFSGSTSSTSPFGLDQYASLEPTPEFAAEFVETCETLFHNLDNHLLQNVVTLRLEGYTDAEIAKQLSCSRRTVQRKLELIRRHWNELEVADE